MGPSMGIQLWHQLEVVLLKGVRAGGGGPRSSLLSLVNFVLFVWDWQQTGCLEGPKGALVHYLVEPFLQRVSRCLQEVKVSVNQEVNMTKIFI